MKRKSMVVGLLLFCMLFVIQPVLASDSLNIYHSAVNKGTLCVYVENPGDTDEVTCQIGKDYSEDVQVKKVTDSEIDVNTYILIDNSLSIQEKYRDTMKQVAKDIVFAKKENENFTIATFDTEIHYLIEGSQDSGALIQAIDQIVFQDLDTHVVDVLYHLYEKIENNDEESISRIIFMSDGMETQTIGYTREELMDKVKESAYPVYVLGCTYKSNETELENMFRISRATNTPYYYLDNVGGADQVAADIETFFNMVQVKAVIPETQQDGALKGVKIEFKSDDSSKMASFNSIMPFGSEQAEESNEDAETADAEEEDTGEASKEGTPVDLRLVLAAAFLVTVLVAVIVIIVILGRKKRKTVDDNNNIIDEDGYTEFLGSEKTEIIADEDATGMADVLNIRLIDIKNPSKIKEFSLESSAVLGRVSGKCKVVFDYEKSISATHCEIYRVDNRVYIRDLGSSNGTYVDGVLVEEATELISGMIIKLGRVQLEFQMI